MGLLRAIPDLGAAGGEEEEERSPRCSLVPLTIAGEGAADLPELRAQRENSCHYCHWSPNALTQRWEEAGLGAGVTGRVTPSIRERCPSKKRVQAVPPSLPSTLLSSTGHL